MDSPKTPDKPNTRPFSERRQQVQKRRQASRRRKKLGEGLQLIFGGGTQMVAVFIAVFLVVSGLWLWRQLEIKNRIFGAPSTSDWEVMSQAVMHRSLTLCDRINESVTLWTPSEFPTLPVRTLRDECRERIIARNTDLHQAMQPLDTRWPSEPVIPVAWNNYKPTVFNESPRDVRPTPITSGNSGWKAQQNQQPQAPAVENQRQLSR